MQEKYPQHITPASTIVKAFNMFLDDDSLSGKVAECVLQNVHFRDPHPVRPRSKVTTNYSRMRSPVRTLLRTKLVLCSNRHTMDRLAIEQSNLQIYRSCILE